MSQIKRGRVAIANGTNVVIGNSDTDWSAVVAGYSLFSLQAAGSTLFLVQTKIAPVSSGSGFWELTLADAGAGNTYTGPTVTGAFYYIHKDFDPTYNFPLFAPGDFVDQVFNRFVLQLAALLGAGFPVLLASFSIATVSLPKPKLFAKIATQNGATVLQWWLLEATAPDSSVGDQATTDDTGARFRQIG